MLSTIVVVNNSFNRRQTGKIQHLSNNLQLFIALTIFWICELWLNTDYRMGLKPKKMCYETKKDKITTPTESFLNLVS